MSGTPGHALYDAAGTRALDRAAIDTHGVAGFTLMRRAGEAAWGELARRWPRATRIAIVCGTGNNGGDGFVIAALARAAGREVSIHLVGEASRIGGDAARAFALAREAGLAPGTPPQDAPNALSGADVVVDALLGTGLDRDVTGAHAAAIDAINDAARPVLAIDVPSGLDASTGARLGVAVVACATVCFIGRKLGLYTGDGPALAGEVVFAALDVPAGCYAAVPARARLVGYADLRAALAPRSRTAHKGHFGHVLVVGGAPGYAGAARMAAEASARVGAGLVSLATHPAHAAVIAQNRPELMCHAVGDGAALRHLAQRASVVALGPGLGQEAWGRAMFATARALDVPQVIDADALNLLAADPVPCGRCVLTPHPGEAARLLGCDTASIARDRLAAAAALVERYAGVVVLKGAGTVVRGAEGLPVVIAGGNPGMASGGMGDVLTGVIAGLLAQGHAPAAAATLGACVHAEAADRAAREGERGLLAGDLMPWLRHVVNPRP
ncbi:MAG: NAD(P)H-hydrate dehydratase [Gammaproteobacteria bacterium]